MTEKTTTYTADVTRLSDQRIIKLSIKRDDGSNIKEFIKAADALKQRTGVEDHLLAEFTYDALYGHAHAVLKSHVQRKPYLLTEWDAQKKFLTSLFAEVTPVSQVLNKYEASEGIIMIVASTYENVDKTWDSMINSLKGMELCKDGCGLCPKDPKSNPKMVCKTSLNIAREMFARALIMERMPDHIKPEVFKTLNPGNIAMDAEDFTKKLLEVEETHKAKGKAEVEAVSDEVDAVRYGKSKNNNRNNGNNNNGNRRRNNNGQKNYNGNRQTSYYNNSNGNNGNNRGNYTRGKSQVIYCFKCKNWGYHIARECKRTPGNVKEIQYADIKPPISEIYDPDWEASRRDQYESNETVTQDELQAALDERKKGRNIPVAALDRAKDGHQGFQ